MKENSNGRPRKEVLADIFAPIDIHGRENLSVINFIEELNKKEKEARKLIANYDYITWLENFTNVHPGFSDDKWLYSPEEISTEDYANVEKIVFFFEILQKYCNKFLIETAVEATFSTNSIHIKHNNIGYEVGLVVGQGSYVYVSREEITEKSIEFTSIMNDVPPKDYEAKTGMLSTLDFLISTMKANEVPEENIISVIKKYYN